MDNLAEEIKRQKDRLEAVDRVSVYLDLDAAHPERPYQGSVDIEAANEPTSGNDSKVALDVYDQGDSYKVEAHEPKGSWEDSFRRYTVPDVMLLLSSLIHRITGSRELDLDKEHWPPCRLVVTREHLTARRERFSSTVTFRGDYFECLEKLRSSVPPEGPPTDLDFEIKGDIPPEHTVEEPPSGPDWLHSDAETEPDEGEVELPF